MTLLVIQLVHTVLFVSLVQPQFKFVTPGPVGFILDYLDVIKCYQPNV